MRCRLDAALVAASMVLSGCAGFTVPYEGEPRDADGDGYDAEEDCDDTNPAINPEAVEVCDGVDNDCDGFIPTHETTDFDFDGVLACNDCNDADADLSVTETFYQDWDWDGYGDPESVVEECGKPVGYVENSADCDDRNGYAFPGQVWHLDLDEDGYGSPEIWVESCTMPGGPWVLDDTDCDDLDPDAYPGAEWFPDGDGDGFGVTGDSVVQCERPTGYGPDPDDCNDFDADVYPGQVWAPDLDGDGYGDANAAVESCGSPDPAYVWDATDCDDAEPTVHPGTKEVCDGWDTNCDGVLPADEEDADGDGYSVCQGDPDDGDPSTYPTVYNFSGILTYVPEADLIGWELCFVDYYGNSGTAFSTISAGCNKARWLVGCRLSGDTTLIAAANAPVSDVQYPTGTGNVGHVANGVEWYWADTYSVGYVEPGDGMSRNSCDTGTGSYPDHRLCWHAGSGQINGGYRCGTTTGLNSSTAYQRVIFHAD